MFYIKKNMSWIMVGLLVVASLPGCGGSLGYFDAFEPRPARVSDFSGKDFDFTWFPVGNPIDNELGSFTLDFGNFGSGDTATFGMAEVGGGTATGSVTFESPDLRFEVSSTSGSISLEPGDVITVVVEADEDDGRIRLTNESNGYEAASDPE